MCRGISCEIAVANKTLSVWFGDPSEVGADRDSHTAIRRHHGLPESRGTAADSRRAPAELVKPTDILAADTYALEWDDVVPGWWSADLDGQLRRALQQEIDRRDRHARETGVWPGSVSGVLGLPDYVREVGGGLNLYGATVPDGAFPALAKVGGSLNLYGATVPDGAFPSLAKVGGGGGFGGGDGGGG